MSPKHLIRLLNCCMEVSRVPLYRMIYTDKLQFIKLLKDINGSNTNNNLCLRLMICEFLATSTCIVLARAEDKVGQNVGAALRIYC